MKLLTVTFSIELIEPITLDDIKYGFRNDLQNGGQLTFYYFQIKRGVLSLLMHLRLFFFPELKYRANFLFRVNFKNIQIIHILWGTTFTNSFSFVRQVLPRSGSQNNYSRKNGEINPNYCLPATHLITHYNYSALPRIRN